MSKLNHSTVHQQPLNLVPWWFLTPFLLLALVFVIGPMLFSLALSFMSWDPIDGLAAMHWIGFENYRFALLDGWFWSSLKTTVWLAFWSGVPQHLIALPLAYAITRGIKRGSRLVVNFYFVPYITSTVAIALVATALFSTDYGLINEALKSIQHWPVLGALMPTESIRWLDSAEGIKPALALVVVWRYLGFNTVLYVAAFQGIPAEIYEATLLDGISSWRRFLFIAVPMIKPTIIFAVTLSFIGGLQLFEEPFILTIGKGGPLHAAMTTAMYMYRTAFEFNDFGTASAMAWLLFSVIAVVVAIFLPLVNSRRLR